MDPNRTSLERAFELARSGDCATVSEIRHRLLVEGYAADQIDGPHLIRQLRMLCESSAGTPAA
jgi:hypothetical protein